MESHLEPLRTFSAFHSHLLIRSFGEQPAPRYANHRVLMACSQPEDRLVIKQVSVNMFQHPILIFLMLILSKNLLQIYSMIRLLQNIVTVFLALYAFYVRIIELNIFDNTDICK